MRCATPVLVASVCLDHRVCVRYDGPVRTKNRTDCRDERWRVDHIENPWVGIHVVEDVVSFPRRVGVACRTVREPPSTMVCMDPTVMVWIQAN